MAATARARSKRVLVYDFAENRTRRMTRTKFEKQYSGGECVQIPIPKGASRIDISPDDLTPSSPVEDSQTSEESAGSATRSAAQVRQNYSASYAASVHIPSSVFWSRALLGPETFPELIVVSPSNTPSNSPNSSPESSAPNSRSTTDSSKTSNGNNS